MEQSLLRCHEKGKEGEKWIRRTREDRILAARCRELSERFGLNQPAEVAAVLRIPLDKAERVLLLAQLLAKDTGNNDR